MKASKFNVLAVIVALLALYWVPVQFFNAETRSAVNALFFVVSLITAGMLLRDIVDLVSTWGAGMSWQAVVAKSGLFLLTAAFSAARLWSFLGLASSFAPWVLQSPVGGFFVYLQGIGLFLIFLGFNGVGEIVPKITARGLFWLGLMVGVIITVAVTKVPF